ncbi:hypothetical protein [Streptomyces sp. NPDC050388]|uniref:hypothetical protein n=1 Tax=Streptomyces sp. NPDC050388 TaxID=3155781 RepID=UPI00341512DC
MRTSLKASVCLVVAAIALTAGCGGGGEDGAASADLLGDNLENAQPSLPKTPEESYKLLVEGLYAGESEQVCALMTPEAALQFSGEMARWEKTGYVGSCPGTVDAFAGKQTAPPEPDELKLHNEVEYYNKNFARSQPCLKTDKGFDMDVLSVIWKDTGDGWIATEVDPVIGCGG